MTQNDATGMARKSRQQGNEVKGKDHTINSNKGVANWKRKDRQRTRSSCQVYSF